jgi:hypothetical protein
MATRKILGILLLLASLLAWLGTVPSSSPSFVTPALAQEPPLRRVNAPYFSGKVYLGSSAIFWFGEIQDLDNYVDVRVGYNDDHIHLYISVADHYLWYDTSPGPDLTEWDAVTIYFDVGSQGDTVPNANDYRFVSQLNDWEDRAAYQAAWQGDGGGWSPASISFTTLSNWRSDPPTVNDNTYQDRGWVTSIYIPFSSLGLSGPPPDGTTWGLAVVLHDRDNAANSPAIPDKSWPETTKEAIPATWGQLTFNPPSYVPPAAVPEGTWISSDSAVEDAFVGGGANCQGTFNTNFGNHPDLYIQNQEDIADHPCFNKTYLRFDLSDLPPDRTIMSATLTLTQFGNSQPSDAQTSLIWLHTLDDDWRENTITWNNAPLARENLTNTRVGVIGPPWPLTPYQWDATQAVAEAYLDGESSVDLALYEADYYYHSGKYFVASESSLASARPKLTVVYGFSAASLSKRVSPVTAHQDEILTYTLTLIGNGEPLTVTDALPAGLGEPGAPAASSGVVTYVPSTRRIEWNGTPAIGQVVNIVFTAPVAISGPIAIHNTAILTTNSGATGTASATAIVDPISAYLPVVFK